MLLPTKQLVREAVLDAMKRLGGPMPCCLMAQWSLWWPPAVLQLPH